MEQADGTINRIIAATQDLVDSELSVQHTTASSTRFRDIETNVSVRDAFTREDYEYFRENEMVPHRKTNIIKGARKAYEKIGIIRNMIDLMGDFTCQGIDIVHPQPQVERFYKAWFNKVSGRERSERFANLLYREANVIVKRDTAKLKPNQVKELKQAFAADITWVKDDVLKREIPFKYTFISPTNVEVIGHELAHFMGDLTYSMRLSTQFARVVKNPKNDLERALVKKLPNYIIDAIVNNNNKLILDSSKTKVYFYKKDDWELWATPMIYPIMDDLVLLEKLKLADTTALDGAISHIRIWKLGNLDDPKNPILPNKKAIEKLRNILLNNVGGGSMDLVWGPDLTIEETSTDISKFLGIEKYEPTMTSIYEGFGIPPSLTGKNQSGFNNNAVSMKTLIERLNYGRAILSKFWEEEIRVVQKAMGFAQPAKLAFDHMTLTDEAAFLSLLVQLVDRNIISEDYLRNKVSNSSIEKSKVNREFREHEDMPKVSPYHNPNTENELKKIALQNGYAPSEVGLELEKKKSGELSKIELDKTQMEDKQPYGPPGQGRPKNSFDKAPRKTRTPKVSGASEDAMRKFIWAQRTYQDISEMVLPGVLTAFGCKNVRSMTDEQFKRFEKMKFAILSNLTPMSTVASDDIIELMQQNPTVPSYITEVYKSLVDGLEEPTIDMLRNAQILSYAVTT